jgi:hypothetical protein
MLWAELPWAENRPWPMPDESFERSPIDAALALAAVQEHIEHHVDLRIAHVRRAQLDVPAPRHHLL